MDVIENWRPEHVADLEASGVCPPPWFSVGGGEAIRDERDGWPRFYMRKNASHLHKFFCLIYNTAVLLDAVNN